MEILDIFQKVKNISDLLNTKEDGLKEFSNKNQLLEKNNFINLANTIQGLKDLNETSTNQTTENNLNNINPFIKILPLLDFEYQKEILFIINFMEIKKIINNYKTSITSASLTQKEDAKKNMLLSIKPKLNPNKQPIIDIFLKFLEINQLLNKFKENYNEF